MTNAFVTITCVCPICGTVNYIQMTSDQRRRFSDWKSGKLLIQDALPDFTPDQREMLMTGICPDCWDKIFKEEEA